jgi:hypothetical protein
VVGEEEVLVKLIFINEGSHMEDELDVWVAVEQSCPADVEFHPLKPAMPATCT